MAQQEHGIRPLPEAPAQLLSVPPLPPMMKEPGQSVEFPMPAAQTADRAKELPSQGTGLTWEQVRARFDTNNPTLRADSLGVDELRAEEITAYLRPNPQLLFQADGTQILRRNGVWQPLAGTAPYNQISYLHERRGKRELRLESAQQATGIGTFQHQDLQRNLTFTLRQAFVQTLEAKALLTLAKADLEYYDKLIAISRVRLKDGDIAQIDLDRIELQRAQYETELQTALVNLRSSKIQLLFLLNDQTPVEQFDVKGTYDFSPELPDVTVFQRIAIAERPDKKAAFETVKQAYTNHRLAIANGSTDPTLAAWETHNSSSNNPNAYDTLGLSVSIPLRIFDRNQGEKVRTAIDIQKNLRTADAVSAQVFSDVDSAYEQVRSNLALLKPYKAQYSDQATRVRDTVSYAYFHGGATLVDFLQAQSDYRTVQTAYLQLIGAYLVAAGQLNLSVGREVIP